MENTFCLVKSNRFYTFVKHGRQYLAYLGLNDLLFSGDLILACCGMLRN